jgi:short-subunit dehydrogenase
MGYKKYFGGFVIVIIAILFSKMDANWSLYFSPPSGDFDGKVVWITGASSGIGASLAKDLTKQGAKVILSARRIDALNAVADSCQGKYKPLVIPLDVTNHKAQRDALNEIFSVYGRIDSVVLNAGRSQRAAAEETPYEATKELFDLNFFSIIHLTKLILPLFLSQKNGQFVIVSSISGFLGTPMGSSYSATKFALHGYFDALRAEVGRDNINVLMICPGPVESEITTNLIRAPGRPHTKEDEKMPTHRCSELMVKAMYYQHSEVWISEQPVLFFSYFAKYFPTFTRMIMVNIAGPARMRLVREGGELFNLKAILGLS